MPAENDPFEDAIHCLPQGWICPVCRRGVAPWLDVCPCRGDDGPAAVMIRPRPPAGGPEVPIIRIEPFGGRPAAVSFGQAFRGMAEQTA